MLVARLFLISPLWAAYLFHETHNGPLHEQTSFSMLLILSGVWFAWLCWMDSGRAPRSSVSVVIRNMGLAFCVVWSFLLLFGAGWFFWYMISHATVWVFLFWQFVVYKVAHHTIYPYFNANYHNVRRAGWHPIWDGGSFNFDSDLIKDGGFEEPEYTNFVPPEDWRFQCPVCGARQQTNFGVCWNCNYGDDGDSTAYHQRWGK